MQKPENILKSTIFFDEVKKIKKNLEEKCNRSVSSQILDMYLEENENTGEIPSRMMMNSMALSLKILLDSEKLFDVIRGIRFWSEILTTACEMGDIVFEKMEEDVLSQ